MSRSRPLKFSTETFVCFAISFYLSRRHVSALHHASSLLCYHTRKKKPTKNSEQYVHLPAS